MLNGRIMIVSDRKEVVAELEPIIRAGQHLSLSVPDGDEALRILEEGLVPDLVISDLGSDRSLEGMDYLWRFREMNRVGRHMVIVEEGAPFSRVRHDDDREDGPTPLRRPFVPAEVKGLIEEAVLRVDRDIRALRGEMFRELSRMQQAMRDIQRETVNALAATIAARDPYMHGHATRVAALARRVATLLRLGAEETDLVETACMLHEIGKGSVPIELLHKTGPLSPDELETIRSHARTGAEIVRQVPSLKRLAPLIEHQGTDYLELGHYIDGGTVDFLLAGILRVVDAYDAMTHARSYRGPMPKEYWEKTLKSGAGKSFHPAAVKALLRVVEFDEAAEPVEAARAA